VELGVDVAADDHGRAHRLHIGLLVEDLAGLAQRGAVLGSTQTAEAFAVWARAETTHLLTERLDLLLCERLAVH
jgi:hypothetical protein